VAVGEVSAEEVAMIYVDQDRCSGCGVCVGVCPVGAIAIQEGKAAIDQERCYQCEACFAACPEQAILTIVERSLVPDESARRAVQRSPISTAAVIAAQVGPALGAALLHLGREVVPWVASYVLDAVERKRGEPAAPHGVGSPGTPDEATTGGAGRHRRRRRRGG
jgi:Fe-S-cluster-containing hydrogenase component 2